MGLNFNFPSQLFFNICTFKLSSVQNFECHNESTFTFPCQVNVSKFTLSKCPSNFKIFKCPSFCFIRIGNWRRIGNCIFIPKNEQSNRKQKSEKRDSSLYSYPLGKAFCLIGITPLESLEILAFSFSQFMFRCYFQGQKCENVKTSFIDSHCFSYFLNLSRERHKHL